MGGGAPGGEGGGGGEGGSGGQGGSGGRAGEGGAGGSGGASSSSTGPGCTSDAECDDGVGCTVDVCGALGCEHAPSDAACDDGLLCTLDSCSATLGCSSVLSNVACDDGLACTSDSCDMATNSCRNQPCDALCDDGSFCNGVERCDAALGCTSGPPACVLGVGCEESSCAEASDTCSHTLPPGCVGPDVHLLACDSAGNLYDVAPYGAPSVTLLAPTNGETFLDVAILNGRWFAITSDLVELAPGTTQIIADLGPGLGNSLGGGPDGKLYQASDAIYRVDPDSGATELVGALPAGHVSSGDIAFLGDRLFVSTDSGCGGALVEFDLATGAGVVLGGDGLGCVYGLASAGGELLLMNCDGKVGTFDPVTGQVSIFATTPVLAYGADQLP